MISRAKWSNLRNVDGARAISAVNSHLPSLVSLLLVVLIGWQLARVIWALVPGSAVGVAVPLPASLPDIILTSGISADVNAIADAHLFGVADATTTETSAAAATEPDDGLADTLLINLTLNGTVASDIPNFSVAIISVGGNDQMVYSIGDIVSSGASLHAVYADRVVLNEKGVLTNLKLPREFKNQSIANVRRSTRSSRQISSNSQSIQDLVSQNLTKLTDVIRPTPYLRNGKPAGYRVYPGRDRRQFAALGLRPGDIIKDIDGQSLQDPTQAMRIFQTLGAADQVTVTIERNGQTQSIILRTSQLDLNGEQTK